MKTKKYSCWWDNKKLVKNICYPHFKEYLNLMNNKYDHLLPEAYEKKVKNFTKLIYLGTLLTDHEDNWGSLDFYYRYDNNLKIIYRVDNCEISSSSKGFNVEFDYMKYVFPRDVCGCPWEDYLMPELEKYLSLI